MARSAAVPSTAPAAAAWPMVLKNVRRGMALGSAFIVRSLMVDGALLSCQARTSSPKSVGARINRIRDVQDHYDSPSALEPQASAPTRGCHRPDRKRILSVKREGFPRVAVDGLLELSVIAVGVAQSCTLRYRRFGICAMAANPKRSGKSAIRQIENLRYGLPTPRGCTARVNALKSTFHFVCEYLLASKREPPHPMHPVASRMFAIKFSD